MAAEVTIPQRQNPLDLERIRSGGAYPAASCSTARSQATEPYRRVIQRTQRGTDSRITSALDCSGAARRRECTCALDWSGSTRFHPWSGVHSSGEDRRLAGPCDRANAPVGSTPNRTDLRRPIAVAATIRRSGSREALRISEDRAANSGLHSTEFSCRAPSQGKRRALSVRVPWQLSRGD